MSKSGVEIGNAVTDLYQTFKLDKSDKHEAWIVFKLSDDKSKVRCDLWKLYWNGSMIMEMDLDNTDWSVISLHKRNM